MKVIFGFLVLIMVSCNSDLPQSETIDWEDLSFHIETRPPFVSKGMIEILLVANRGEHKRAFDLLVSYRIGQQGKWVQAIQDGHTGVYRRALNVVSPETDILNVHVKYNNKEKILEFPLAYAIKP